jgi:hypothetical protein
VPPRHPYTKNFLIVIILGSGHCFCFALAKVFLQGATTPPLHHFLQLLWEGGIMLLLRLSHGISSGCHHVTPTPIFICHYCVKAALCFCFDLAKAFLQGATMPPLHLKIFWICHYCWKGTLCFCSELAMLFLHGATMPPVNQNFFGIVIVSGSLALCFFFDLDKVFLLGAATPPLHHFLELSLF